jgi:hypothetical protein
MHFGGWLGLSVAMLPIQVVADRQDMSGTWFCYTEHATGMLREDRKPDYFGTVSQTEDQKKFFATVSPVRLQGLVDVEACRKSFNAHMDRLAKGIPFKDPVVGEYDDVLYSNDFIAAHCLPKDQVALKQLATSMRRICIPTSCSFNFEVL